MQELNWLVIGNGVSAHILERLDIPPSVRTVGLNRHPKTQRADVITTTYTHYLRALPDNQDWSAVYVPHSLDTAFLPCRVQVRQHSAIMTAFALLASWQQRHSVLIGFDGVTLGLSEPYQSYPHQRRGYGTISGPDRWRRQLQEARRETGIIPVIAQTEQELKNWFASCR